MRLKAAEDPVRTVTALAIPPGRPGGSLRHPRNCHTLAWQLIDEPSVQGALQFTRVAWLDIGRVRAGAHRVVCDARRLVGRTASEVHIVLQLGGMSVFEQGDHAFTLQSGRWALLTADRSYSITSRTKAERLGLVIGSGRLSMDIRLHQLSGRPYSAAHGAGRLFFASVLALADELPNLRTEDAPMLAEQVTSLLHLALRREVSINSVEDPDGRRERVQRYISRHLRDPSLNVDRIAADLGWSRRTLARIFEMREESLMEYVYRERLESVRRDLLNPLLRERTLGQLARSWGFRDYTHFCARFRSHFGLPPSVVRGRGAGALAERSGTMGKK